MGERDARILHSRIGAQDCGVEVGEKGRGEEDWGKKVLAGTQNTPSAPVHLPSYTPKLFRPNARIHAQSSLSRPNWPCRRPYGLLPDQPDVLQPIFSLGHPFSHAEPEMSSSPGIGASQTVTSPAQAPQDASAYLRTVPERLNGPSRCPLALAWALACPMSLSMRRIVHLWWTCGQRKLPDAVPSG